MDQASFTIGKTQEENTYYCTRNLVFILFEAKAMHSFAMYLDTYIRSFDSLGLLNLK